jgi:hypothetical protein
MLPPQRLLSGNTLPLDVLIAAVKVANIQKSLNTGAENITVKPLGEVKRGTFICPPPGRILELFQYTLHSKTPPPVGPCRTPTVIVVGKLPPSCIRLYQTTWSTPTVEPF